MSISTFWEEACSSFPQLMAVVLALGVLFVNGWTDAPNAIASAVASRALSMGKAAVLATVMNVLGGISSLYFGQKVAKTMEQLSAFPPDRRGEFALLASLLAVVLWAVTAWYFGIPTSESHGLMAAVAGASLALGAGGLSLTALFKVLAGLIFSVGAGFLGGWCFAALFRRQKQERPRLWRRGQQIAAALMAFAHGLQDTPKLAALLFLGSASAQGNTPLWGVLLCSGMMGLGTLCAGERIIRKVGEEMVQIEEREGFAADLAGGLSLVLSTLQGMPVSTTHAKTCAMMGAAMSKKDGSIDPKVVSSMFWAWGLTFPLCAALGFLLTRLFLLF